MSKPKLTPIAILLTLTAALASACDPVATVLDTFGGPTSLCTDLGNNECRRPNPDDLQPS